MSRAGEASSVVTNAAWILALLATATLGVLEIAGVIHIAVWAVFLPVLFMLGWTLVVLLIAFMIMAVVLVVAAIGGTTRKPKTIVTPQRMEKRDRGYGR